MLVHCKLKILTALPYTLTTNFTCAESKARVCVPVDWLPCCKALRKVVAVADRTQLMSDSVEQQILHSFAADSPCDHQRLSMAAISRQHCFTCGVVMGVVLGSAFVCGLARDWLWWVQASSEKGQ